MYGLPASRSPTCHPSFPFCQDFCPQARDNSYQELTRYGEKKKMYLSQVCCLTRPGGITKCGKCTQFGQKANAQSLRSGPSGAPSLRKLTWNRWLILLLVQVHTARKMEAGMRQSKPEFQEVRARAAPSAEDPGGFPRPGPAKPPDSWPRLSQQA